MLVAVTETARVMHPLSASISNGIMRSINKAFDLIVANRRRNNDVKDIAYALKLEYPHESYEYVLCMAHNLYEGSQR